MNTIAGLIKKSDISLIYLLNRKIQCQLLNVIMKKMTHLGSITFSVVLLTVLFLYARNGTRSISIQMLLTLLISQSIVQTIKRVVNRPRPYTVHLNIVPINPPMCRYSFPSGHTCAAFCIALILSISFPGYSFLFIFLAIVIGFSRIYLGVHYPTDVVMGVVIAYGTVRIDMLLGII